MKSLSVLSWLAVPLVTLVFLIARETTRPTVAVAVEQGAVRPAAPTYPSLPTATLALAFGYHEPGAQAASPAGLVLKASFISSRGTARVLVASGQDERFYQVGDRLPGGHVVRHIDVRSMTLWDGNGERRVTLSEGRTNHIYPSGGARDPGPAAADPPRLLREVQ